MSQDNNGVGDEGTEDIAALKQKVKTLEDEVEELKSSIAKKDKEIERLKSQPRSSGGQIDAARAEDLKQIQERLAQLKKEQAEANQARDAAWKHLKESVQEVARIVSQNDINSLTSSVTAPIWKKDEMQ